MSKINRGRELSDVAKRRLKVGHVPDNDEAANKLLEELRNAVATAKAESIDNLIVSLASVPTIIAARALAGIGQDLRDESLPLLEQLANTGNAALDLAATDAMGLTRSEKAVPVLVAIAERGESKELQKAARRSLFRLKSTGVAGADLPSKTESASPLTRQPGILQQAFMSNHDGSGHQVLEAIAEAPFGGADEVLLLVSDIDGIEQFNFGDTTRKAWQRRIDAQNRDYPGVTLVEIPVDYFRQKAKQAYELSQSSGKAVSPRFDRWRDYFVDIEEAEFEHPIYREISLVEIKWNPELLEQSPQILKNVELEGWLWPGEELQSYVLELRAVKEGRITLPTWVEAEKGEGIINRALDHFLDAKGRARYKRRLEDVAYVLFHTERQLDAKRALAAANAFDEKTGVETAKNPFAMALFTESIAHLLGGEDSQDAREAEGGKLVTDISEIARYLTAGE